MIIAVDGPAASGKGTIARRLAAHLNLPYLDTGLLYRGVAHALLQRGQDGTDAAQAHAIALALDVETLDDEALRSAAVGAMASVVAAIPAVRAALLEVQKAFAGKPQGAVLDGRDIGTVICPHADVKLFVTASSEVRAHRRSRRRASSPPPALSTTSSKPSSTTTPVGSGPPLHAPLPFPSSSTTRHHRPTATSTR